MVGSAVGEAGKRVDVAEAETDRVCVGRGGELIGISFAGSQSGRICIAGAVEATAEVEVGRRFGW